VPFDGTAHTVVIACSKEAKARGVKNVMKLADARKLCPELILQCQSPDLYRRAHNALLAEINSVIPIEAVKSIDDALHGYDVMAQKSERGMFGHGRVLPPELRNFKDARDCTRLLLVKAARRMRREGFYASSLYMWVSLRNRSIKEKGWSSHHKLHMANDDQACLTALDALWAKAKTRIPSHYKIVRVGVTLGDLTTASTRQLDMLINDDPERLKPVCGASNGTARAR